MRAWLSLFAFCLAACTPKSPSVDAPATLEAPVPETAHHAGDRTDVPELGVSVALPAGALVSTADGAAQFEVFSPNYFGVTLKPVASVADPQAALREASLDGASHQLHQFPAGWCVTKVLVGTHIACGLSVGDALFECTSYADQGLEAGPLAVCSSVQAMAHSTSP